MQQDGKALVCADPALRDDRTVVLEAVKRDGMALQFATKGIRMDDEIVSKAIQNNTVAQMFLIKAPAPSAWATKLNHRQPPVRHWSMPLLACR